MKRTTAAIVAATAIGVGAVGSGKVTAVNGVPK